jgi:hypothetical protein
VQPPNLGGSFVFFPRMGASSSAASDLRDSCPWREGGDDKN